MDGLIQPVTQPVFDTRHAGDLLLEVGRALGDEAAAGLPRRGFYRFLRDEWERMQPVPEPDPETTEPVASGITNDLVWGVAPVRANGEELGRVVVAWRIPDEIQSRRAAMLELFGEYRTVEAERTTFKYFYLGLLALIAIFVLFVSVWLALYLSRQISAPIVALIDATAEVSSGHLEHRVDVPAMDELGGLIASFNHMTQRLEEQTSALQESNQELENANAEIDSRRLKD